MPGAELPLATARNRGVAAASGETIVFLDVDCIPSPDLVADYARGLSELDGLLGRGASSARACHFGRLDLRGASTASPRSIRSPRTTQDRHRDLHRLPLLLVTQLRMRRATFLAIGGFDERYRGYGGEDTDFGKILDRRGIPIAWIKGALSYHQYHGTTCRRSIISTAWSACGTVRGQVGLSHDGPLALRLQDHGPQSTIRRIGRSASYDGRMPTTSP